jgi:hypothetical protein
MLLVTYGESRAEGLQKALLPIETRRERMRIVAIMSKIASRECQGDVA